MKGIVLAGGLGTRLRPLTYATNKHLLPVFDKPLIHYPIQTLVNAGVRDIMVVTGGMHAGDFINVLRNGEAYGIDGISYAYQVGEGGIADALKMAEAFVNGDKCVVVLGDNIIADDITPYVREFEIQGGACIFTKEVPDPERFGVVDYGETGWGDIEDIIEKPESPPSSDAVIGLYMYDSTVFDRIRELKPSGRGELEVTDLNKSYLETGDLSVHRILGTWLDCGTSASLLKAGALMYEDSMESAVKNDE